MKKFNALGQQNIVIVDNYDEVKFKNLKSLSFTDYISYKQRIPHLKAALGKYDFSSLIHIGANADVLVKDADVMLEANYEHSKLYLEMACERNIPLLYASSSAVYGNTNSLAKGEDPHNVYAWSKWLFDKHIQANLPSFQNKVIGLRLFNIFGMGEFHKGKNASLPLRFFSFLQEKGFIDVFDIPIQRDYVWVEDVADVIIDLLNDATVANGIYDLGGGSPVLHTEVAALVSEAFVEKGIKSATEQLVTSVPMPKELVGSFQFSTKATNLLPLIAKRTAGNREKMKAYINQLLQQTYDTNTF